MMHKAWCCTEEVPHCFSRSCIIFQGHTGQKIDDLNKIWERLLGLSQLLNPSDLPSNFTYDLEQGKSEGFDSCDRPSNLTQIGLKSLIFQPVWPWNLMNDPKNDKAPLLYYIKLCASFQIHQWIQTGVTCTVRKRPIGVKIDDFFSSVTLQFDIWPWKTIGHLFYATSSFVHHFVPIGKFKLELQSGNAQSGSNSTIFRAVWPWNLTDDLAKQ